MSSNMRMDRLALLTRRLHRGVRAVGACSFRYPTAVEGHGMHNIAQLLVIFATRCAYSCCSLMSAVQILVGLGCFLPRTLARIDYSVQLLA